MPITSPIVSWIGGKRRLAAQLLPLFPPHTCYVELFCGGAALYFLREKAAKVEVINDSNGELTNLYRVVQHHPDEFMRQFTWGLSSRTAFRWQQMTPPETLTDIERAARFYFLQQHAFGGRVASHSFGTATTTPSVNFSRLEEKLRAAHHRLAGTFIENLPWQECMRLYDRPHTFFYADPPYWKMEGYGVPFGIEQYEELAEFMRTCKGKVLLSINDHPDMRRIFAGFPMKELTVKYSLGNNFSKSATVGELAVWNWGR